MPLFALQQKRHHLYKLAAQEGAAEVNTLREDATSPTTPTLLAAAEYQELTVAELRSLAQERGVVGCSRMNKTELIAALEKATSNEAMPEQGGIL